MSRRVWAGVLTGLLPVLAACSPAAPSSPTPSAAPPTTSSIVQLPPDRRTVPVRVVRGPGGAACVVTDVDVGFEPGVSRVTVLVDTASSGLLVPARSVGPFAVPTGVTYPNGLRDGGPFPVDEVETAFGLRGPDGQRVVGSIYGGGGATIGSLPTDDALAGPSARCGPVGGVLGIAIGGSGPESPELGFATATYDRPLSDGVGLGLSGDTGTITIGPPEVTPRSALLPLTRRAGTYPNSDPAYQRDVELCWTVGPARGCGPTTIGSASPGPTIRPDLVPGVAGPVPDGTPVSISTPAGAVLDSFVTGPAPAEHRLTTGAPRGSAVADTGIGLLLRNAVAFDLTTGQAVITPR